MVNVIVPPVLRGKKISFVQTTLAPLLKISWKLNEATPKFMISKNFSWPSSSTYTSLVSPVILICQVMSGRKIHSNSFVNLLPKVTRFRAFRRITENASARWFIPLGTGIEPGGLIPYSVQFVFWTSGNDAVHNAGLNWSNSPRVSKILSNLIKLLYITNFTKSKNP